MADNILRGTIKIDAPNVKQTASAVAASVDKMSDAVKKAAINLNNVPKASNTATQSLTNLSRVAQDLPYGFIGIANNLNPLLESFQRLKQESGSSKEALKALGNSLMGAGGLGLALGIGSALLVKFGDKLLGMGDNAEEARKEVEALTNALEYLSSETQRVGHDLDNEGKIRIANLKAAGASEQQIYEATNEELVKKRDLLRDLQSDLSQTAAKIQRTKGFDLDVFNERLSTGQPLEGIYEKFNVTRLAQLKAEKDYYDNEAAIQILGAENRERQRKEDEKKLKEHHSRLEDLQFNFFDRFFKITPKAGERPKQIAEMFKVATEFALENQSIFVGLDKILKADTQESAVNVAKQWWEDFRNGIYRFRLEPLKTFTSADIKTNKKPEIDVKLNPIRTLPQTERTKDILNQVQSYAEFGARLGKALGDGFEEQFRLIFTAGIQSAITQGLSGEALEQFKAQFAALSISMIAGVQGVTTALDLMVDNIFAGKNAFENMGDAIKGVLSGLIKQLIRAVALAGILSAVSGGKVSFASAFTKVLGLNKGGLVPGSGNTDTVPAMLTPGEYVVPKKDVPKVMNILNGLESGNNMFQSTFKGLKSISNFSLPDFSKVTIPQARASVGHSGPVQFPDYIAMNDLSGDTLIQWLARANKKGSLVT